MNGSKSCDWIARAHTASQSPLPTDEAWKVIKGLQLTDKRRDIAALVCVLLHKSAPEERGYLQLNLVFHIHHLYL